MVVATLDARSAKKLARAERLDKTAGEKKEREYRQQNQDGQQIKAATKHGMGDESIQLSSDLHNYLTVRPDVSAV